MMPVRGATLLLLAFVCAASAKPGDGIGGSRSGPQPPAVLPSGATQARSPADRFSDVHNIRDFGTSTNWAAALSAACAAVPATGGKVYLPAGIYALATPVTDCGGKPIALEGDGPGLTNLVLTTQAAGIRIEQTDLRQTVHVRGLRITSSAPAAVAWAFDISFPSAASSVVQALTVDDLVVQSRPPPGIAPPYAGSFMCGMRIRGAWQSRITNFTFSGPVQGTNLPVPGTCGIDVQNAYNLDIESPNVFYADVAVLQSGYSEYLSIAKPKFVNVAVGLAIRNSVRPDKGNRSGLSYYMTGGEIDATEACVQLAQVNDAWLYGNHCFFGRVPGGSGFVLNGTNGAQVYGNKVAQGGANLSATGVAVTGASSANKILGNALDTQASVVLGVSTSYNVVSANTTDPPASPAYSDAGTANSVTWLLPGGRLSGLAGHVLAGASGQTLVNVPNVPGAVNITVLKAAPTGQSPVLLSDGPGADVSLDLQAKGRGTLGVRSRVVLREVPLCETAGLEPGSVCHTDTNVLKVTP